jgi:capsular polysaccharide biosynthesis protein
MSEEMIEVKDKEISFSVLFKVLKKYFIVVIIATIILGLVAGAYSAFFQKTRYTAKSEFLVKNILPTAGYINAQMIETAAYIASTCVEVSTKDILAKKAVRDHELDKYFQCPESEAIKYVMSMKHM